MSGITIVCVSNVISVTSGAQAEAESLLGKKDSLPLGSGKERKENKKTPHNFQNTEKSSKQLERCFKKTLDIGQGKDDLLVRAFDSMSCYQKVQQKILATNFNSANIARHPLGARKYTKLLGVKR